MVRSKISDICPHGLWVPLKPVTFGRPSVAHHMLHTWGSLEKAQGRSLFSYRSAGGFTSKLWYFVLDSDTRGLPKETHEITAQDDGQEIPAFLPSFDAFILIQHKVTIGSIMRRYLDQVSERWYFKSWFLAYRWGGGDNLTPDQPAECCVLCELLCKKPPNLSTISIDYEDNCLR